MKKLLLIGALLAGGTLGLQNTSDAHGGTYRGPGDTVPPGGGGGGGGGSPGTPGPGNPSTPGPSGPSSPNPGTPAPGGGPAKAPTAIVTGVQAGGAELTQWQFWWGFNKEPYLNLKRKIHAAGVTTGSDDFFLGRNEQNAKSVMRPSEAKIRDAVVPAILKALETERNNDIVTGCLIALAKIGDKTDEGGESQFQQTITKYLKDPTQEIAETAAVALGILANESAIETLVALMIDGKLDGVDVDPHALVGATEVPMRTRAFAAYGLGLIGYATDKNEVRQRIAEYLMDMLDAPELSTRDVKVAAMISLGLTRLDIAAADATAPAEDKESPHADDAFSRQSQLEFLLAYYDEASQRSNKDTRHYFTIAHAPTAMARLMLDAEGKLVEEAFDTGKDSIKERVATALLDGIGQHTKREREIEQSCTLALGQVGDCDNGATDTVDKSIRKELIRQIKDGEEQSKRFALISLAQIAGRPGRGEDKLGGLKEVTVVLLDTMDKGQSKMRPWAALSLGVMGRALLDAGQTPDLEVDRVLAEACAKQKNPEDAGAYCLALGLRKYRDGMPILLEHMQETFKGSDDARGEAAVALGLIEDRSAIEPIEAVIDESEYKPELLKQAAIALGLLGDKKVVGKLVDMLSKAKGLATQSAISSALGMIGDVNSIDPLIGLLQNKEVVDTARGFAAVALGIVCDKEDLPWNTKIAVNTNYRANTVTLTGEGGTGILDIL